MMDDPVPATIEDVAALRRPDEGDEEWEERRKKILRALGIET